MDLSALILRFISMFSMNDKLMTCACPYFDYRGLATPFRVLELMTALTTYNDNDLTR
jgi:hypothetical protein